MTDERFALHVGSVTANGPAGAEADDLNADGDLDHWRAEEVFSPDADIYFPNESLPIDIDGDGDHEVVFTSYETDELLVLDYQG